MVQEGQESILYGDLTKFVVMHPQMSYSEIARQRNPNINIFFMSSEDIEKKSDEMAEHWHQILPV